MTYEEAMTRAREGKRVMRSVWNLRYIIFDKGTKQYLSCYESEINGVVFKPRPEADYTPDWIELT